MAPDNTQRTSEKKKMDKTRSHNRGRRQQARCGCPYDTGQCFYFKTNCAIACSTRAYMLRGFL